MSDKIYIDGDFDPEWYSRSYKKEADHKRKKLQPCDHHKKKQIGYVAWHDWAEAMIKSGHEQKKCPYCNRFFFEDEMNDPNIKFPEPKPKQS